MARSPRGTSPHSAGIGLCALPETRSDVEPNENEATRDSTFAPRSSEGNNLKSREVHQDKLYRIHGCCLVLEPRNSLNLLKFGRRRIWWGCRRAASANFKCHSRLILAENGAVTLPGATIRRRWAGAPVLEEKCSPVTMQNV
jgi:hypothetical protein